MKYWDIFCKVVDNFGDIGVCWRLAKQLHAEHGIDITLWVDDLAVAKHLIPSLNLQQSSQPINGIHIKHWLAQSKFEQAADVVIEAFGCDLPAAYQALMQPGTIWINLEYLSAESWVADFHGRHAKRGQLTRHFYFPGFGINTGGLLRERQLSHNQQQLVTNHELQHAFWQHLGLSSPAEHTVKVSLFCYPNAPVSALLNAMATGLQQVECYIPGTNILANVADFFKRDSLAAGEACSHKNLTVRVLPFLSQADYDNLLTLCDINFVRGEDSWIRAVWAGKPFVWQPYWQTEDTHLIKLNAFLATYFNQCDPASRQASTTLHLAWTNATLEARIWQDYVQHLRALQSSHAARSAQLATLPDLASNLVIFIENLRMNKL